MQFLQDGLGRRFRYLRLSLIDACNFRCGYCLPNGSRGSGCTPLSVEEIVRLVATLTRVGVSKVRLTGGEPSLRRDLTAIIAALAACPGIRTVALTSNGCLLDRRAAQWRAAGLDALNLSIDSLDRERFAAITGHDRLPSLLAGVERALDLGFAAIKLNAVLLKDINDDELDAWLDYVRTRPLSLRYIELMRTGDNADYFARHHRPAVDLAQCLRERGWQPLPRAADGGPAQEYAHPDYRGRIGLITPYGPDFCQSCNRLRVTAAGDLRLCLFGEHSLSLRPLLQHDGQRDELLATLAAALRFKAPAHRLHEAATGLTTNLATLGG